MKFNISSKIEERRKKRVFVPAFYCLAELVLAWLVLSLIQVNFNMLNWNLWSLIVFTVYMAYSLAKTVYIYKRQKKYKS